MATDKDEVEKFINVETENNFEFPVILRTQRSCIGSKNDPLRRNTSIRASQFRKSEARLVTKRGRVKIYFRKIPKKSIIYARDLWNTLVDMQWRWLALVVAFVNLMAYSICGLLFYYDAWFSGDFDNDPNTLICITGVQNLRNIFMLGIETVTTTGYGYVYPTEYCSFYWVVLTFSTIINILIDGAFISVVYAKLNRPKDIYGQIFSKKAVISMRNGKLCLIIRINDREGKHWINSDLHLYLVQEIKTLEGEVNSNHLTDLKVLPFGMLFWPVDIVHEIGPDSPLWDLSAHDFMTRKLEILVVLSGSSVKTGQSTRSQTSYLNREIMWGYQFSPCLEYNSDKSEFIVNKRLFNQTTRQEVPLCSAKVLEELQNGVEMKGRSSSFGQLENIGIITET